MGNTHDTEIARIEADYIHTKWRTTEDYRWGYSCERGPDTWWVYYPSASGSNQSPIDVVTEEVTFDPEFRRNQLRLCYRSTSGAETRHGKDREDQSLEPAKESLVLVNTGNTARVKVLNSQSYVTGGPCLEQSYVLQHVNIHWGEDDEHGSEHRINSHSFPAELQLVHWNEHLYPSYEEASKREDGIVIIAIFVQVTDEPDSNKGLRSISELLQETLYREQTAVLPADIDARNFLPDNVSNYWTYKGSFTTPPCFETVTWVVFSDTIRIRRRDLGKFRQMRCYSDNEMRPEEDFDGLIARNYRNVQPIGTRKIFTSENPHHDEHHHDHDDPDFHAEDPFRPAAPLSTRLPPTFPAECVRQCGRT